MIDRGEIEAAARRIEGRVRKTPTIDVELDGRPVLLKLELLQHTGSFKPRGAFNRVLAAGEIPPVGVIAASGGNHGAAVAYVAAALGIPCEIFVPEATPDVKRERIESFGAKLVVTGEHYPDAYDSCVERQAASGALQVHAYDHPHVVAGQGTIGIELSKQAPQLESLLVAIGGGGLIAGIAGWLQDDVKVIGVEPETSCALHAALAAGREVEVPVSGLAADALGARQIGHIAFEVASRFVPEVVLVNDDEIRQAQAWLWDRLRLIAEPGGAAALAALLSGRYRPEGPVGVVVCGANTDPQTVTALPRV